MIPNPLATQQFETRGRWLFAVHLATAIGLAVGWASLFGVDPSDRPLSLLVRFLASLYLAIASFLAAMIYRSCESPLARAFFILSAAVAASAMLLPAVEAVVP